jgi:hypothetical protein
MLLFETLLPCSFSKLNRAPDGLDSPLVAASFFSAAAWFAAGSICFVAPQMVQV